MKALVSNEHEDTKERALDLVNKVDHILQNHSGVGVKTLKLELCSWYNVNTCYLDSWLTTAVTPGIQELALFLPLHHNRKAVYNFPCSLLSDRSGKSIRYLYLTCCSFLPKAGLGCLTRLRLRSVCISDDELGCFLSNSLALKHLELKYCDEIISLKIPCLLRQLKFLSVCECNMLQAIESNAPNISTVHFDGDLVQISLGDGSLQVKELKISCSGNSDIACYALAKLPSVAPNHETLIISMPNERVNTPMVPGKFLHLKYLSISLPRTSPVDGYLSLFSFLNASPALETFILWSKRNTTNPDMSHGDSSHLTWAPECCHGNLKNVTIHGFCPTRIMIKLTCHMLEKVTSLECFTLDTTYGYFRCSSSKTSECFPVLRDVLREAHKSNPGYQKIHQGESSLYSLLASCGALQVVPCAHLCRQSLTYHNNCPMFNYVTLHGFCFVS